MKPSANRAGAGGYARLGLPIHVHPLDPIAPHRAAEAVGWAVARAVGRQLLQVHAISPTARVLAAEAALAGDYSGDPGGLQARLAWTAHDACTAHTWHRRRADYAVRRAAIEAIETGADLAEIEAAAETVAADLGAIMPVSRAKTIARVELAIERRRRETLSEWWDAPRQAGGEAGGTK